MSLDIYLEQPAGRGPCPRCGQETDLESEVLHDQNITHNLGSMAREAGIYGALWRPEENGIETAKQLAEAIRPGFDRMQDKPSRFRKFDASNGWGTYDDFMPWLRRLLEACDANPLALVRASR